MLRGIPVAVLVVVLAVVALYFLVPSADASAKYIQRAPSTGLNPEDDHNVRNILDSYWAQFNPKEVKISYKNISSDKVVVDYYLGAYSGSNLYAVHEIILDKIDGNWNISSDVTVPGGTGKWSPLIEKHVAPATGLADEDDKAVRQLLDENYGYYRGSKPPRVNISYENITSNKMVAKAGIYNQWGNDPNTGFFDLYQIVLEKADDNWKITSEEIILSGP